MLYSNKQTNLLTLCAIFSGVVAAFLRIFSLVLFYDTDIGYYSAGAVLPVISNVFTAASLLALALCAFLLLKKIEVVPAPNKTSGYAAFLPAAALVIYAVLKIVDVAKNSAYGKADNLDLLTVAVSIVSAVFFVSLAFSQKKTSATSVICGTGFIIWLALAWIHSYTDFLIAMNSPDKIFFHLGCIGAALLVVAELRTVYLISKPKFYYFSLWFAMISLAVSSIPAIVGDLCDVYLYYPTKNEDIVLLALFVYTVIRAFSLLSFEKAEPVQPEEKSVEPTEEPTEDTENIL